MGAWPVGITVEHLGLQDAEPRPQEAKEEEGCSGREERLLDPDNFSFDPSIHIYLEEDADGQVAVLINAKEAFSEERRITLSYAFTVWNEVADRYDAKLKVIVVDVLPTLPPLQKDTAELIIHQSDGGDVSVVSGDQGCDLNSPTCSISDDQPLSVSIQATEEPGFLFKGWGGDCASNGMANPLLVEVDINERVQCSATFEELPVVSIVPAAGGRVLGPNGIDCSPENSATSQCRAVAPEGEVIMLRADADAGFQLARWNSTCTGQIMGNDTYEITVDDSCSVSPEFQMSEVPLDPVTYELDFDENSPVDAFTPYEITITNAYGGEIRYEWFLGGLPRPDGSTEHLTLLEDTDAILQNATQISDQQIGIRIFVDNVLKAQHVFNIDVSESTHNPMNVEQSQFQVNAGTPVTFNAKMFDFENIQMNPTPLPVTMLHEVQTLEWILIDEDTKATSVLDTISIPMEINPDNITDPNAINQHNILTTFSYTPDAANTSGYWIHTKATLTDGSFILGSAFLTVN